MAGIKEVISGLYLKARYPKFILLGLTFFMAYIIFDNESLDRFRDFFMSLGYTGFLIAGALFAYGFTAAPATALLLLMAKEYSIFLGAAIAGLGTLASNLIIFNFIRASFADEIDRLSKEKIMIFLGLKAPNIFKKYFLPVIGGFLIATPLPDEIGVSLLSASGRISAKVFSALTYLLSVGGIFIIMLIGKNLE